MFNSSPKCLQLDIASKSRHKNLQHTECIFIPVQLNIQKAEAAQVILTSPNNYLYFVGAELCVKFDFAQKNDLSTLNVWREGQASRKLVDVWNSKIAINTARLAAITTNSFISNADANTTFLTLSSSAIT